MGGIITKLWTGRSPGIQHQYVVELRAPAFLCGDPGLIHRLVGVGFIVDEVALGKVFLQVLFFPPSLSFHQRSILSIIYDRRCIISSTDSGFLVSCHQLTTVPELFDHSWIDVICSHYTLQSVLLNGLALVMSEASRKITVSCGPLSWPSLTAASCKVIAVIFVFRCTMKSFSFCEGDGFLIKVPWAHRQVEGKLGNC